MTARCMCFDGSDSYTTRSTDGNIGSQLCTSSLTGNEESFTRTGDDDESTTIR